MANPAPGFEKHPNHTVVITPGTGALRVTALGREIARSERPMRLAEARYPEVSYIPLEDLDQTALVESDTQTYCPFKGHASYYHIQVGDQRVEDAVWYYPDPYDECLPIKNYAAFYADKVTLESS